MFTNLRRLWVEFLPKTVELAPPYAIDSALKPSTVKVRAGDGFLIDIEKAGEPTATAQYSPNLTREMTGYYALNPRVDAQLLNRLHLTEQNKVYIYNVSRSSFDRSHPVLGKNVIPGIKGKEKYTLFTSIPETIAVPKDFLESPNTLDISINDGKRVAMDFINPDNLGLDQNVKSTMYSLSVDTNNFGKRGLFWSMHNPPLKEEVAAARKRMATYYKSLLEKVNTLLFCTGMTFNERVTKLANEYKTKPYMEKYTQKQRKQAAKEYILKQLEITPEHHLAAEFFKLTPEWHPILDSQIK